MINYRIAFEIFKEPGARAVAFRRSRTARYLSFFSPFHHRPVPPTGQDCTPRYSRQPAAVRSSSSSRGRYLRRVTLLHGVRISAARESHPKCPFNAAAGIYRVTLIYYAYIYIYRAASFLLFPFSSFFASRRLSTGSRVPFLLFRRTGRRPFRFRRYGRGGFNRGRP